MPEWEQRLSEESRNHTVLCQRHQRRPPRVAVCIAGSARAFASPLALAGFRYNVFDALGTSARAFLHLKTGDSPKWDGWMGQFSAHHEAVSNASSIQTAISAQPWLTNCIAEAVIVNGSGSYLGAGSTGVAVHNIMVAQADEHVWREYAPRHCYVRHNDGKEYLHSKSAVDEARVQRHLLFHLSQEWCHGAIERDEVATGFKYEVVAYSRPDLLWFRPMPAFCTTNYSAQAILSCPDMGCDMAWTVPRKYAKRMLSLATAHRDCSVKICCTEDTERATGRAARESGANENHIFAWLHRRTILRNIQGVCNVVTHPYYSEGNWAYKKAATGVALPISTGIEIRRMVDMNHANLSYKADVTFMGPLLKQAAVATGKCEKMLGATPCGKRSLGIPCGWGEKF